MVFKFTRFKKVLAALSITGLVSFGFAAMATAATEVTTNFNYIPDNGTFNQAEVTDSQICFNYSGLLPEYTYGLQNATMTLDQTSVSGLSARDQADQNGAVSFCFARTGALAEVNGFDSYNGINLSGDFSYASYDNKTVNVTTTYLNGDTQQALTGVTRTEIYVTDGYLCVNYTGLPAGYASFAISGSAKKGEETVTADDSNQQYNDIRDGWSSFCTTATEGGDWGSMGMLGQYDQFDLTVVLTYNGRGQVQMVVDQFVLGNGIEPQSIVHSDDYVNPQTACFRFTGAQTERDYIFSNISITLVKEGQDNIVLHPDDQYVQAWDEQGTIEYCYQDEAKTYANLSMFDQIKFSSTLALPSTMSEILGKYLETKALSYSQPNISYNPRLDRTYFSILVANRGQSRIALESAGVQVAGKDLKDAPKLWVVDPTTGPTEEDPWRPDGTYIDLGYLDGNYSVGGQLDVWTFLKTATPSTLTTSAVVLPQGLVVTGNAFDLFYQQPGGYPGANTTILGIPVRNTTQADITIAATLTWKVGATRLTTKGTEVVTIKAGKTGYIEGNNIGGSLAAGDVRIGNVLSVTGSVKKVTANTNNNANLIVPEGVTVREWMYEYDEVTKKTRVSVIFGTPPGNQEVPEERRDLLASSLIPVKIGTVKTNTIPIAAVPAQAGGWSDYVPHRAVIGFLTGDKRYGQKIDVTATFAWSDNNQIDSQGLTGNEFQNAYCQVWEYGPQWTLTLPTTLTGRPVTTVTVTCWNGNDFEVKADMSALTGSYKLGEASTVQLTKLPTSQINAVVLKPGVTTEVKVFTTTGDIRTGSYKVTLSGPMVLTKK